MSAEAVKTITAKEVFDAVHSSGKTWIGAHDCSICGVEVGYVVHGDQIGFRHGCGCIDRGIIELRTWQDPADWINVQTNHDARSATAARFGIILPKEESGTKGTP